VVDVVNRIGRGLRREEALEGADRWAVGSGEALAGEIGSVRKERGMRSIVITGVSSGIGYGAAKEFANNGYRVFGSVRKEEDAERLAAELGPSFTPLLFDVTDREAVLRAAERVGEVLDGSGLAGLVNNAGTAIGGPLMHQPLDEVRRHFEVNVVGLVSVTQAFLPLLGAKKPRTHEPGRVLNISSVGGKIASPFIGAYAGTKHAVEGISDSLRRELMPYGIDVVVIEPGAVRTEIWDKGAAGAERYADTDYADSISRFGEYAVGLAKNGYSPEEFGRFVREVFEKRRPRTRYAISPRKFANFTVPRLLPDRWLDRLIARNVGLT
jgi:NAD(P)-dependent dehydrogenase (short-subunit alcohol dehydrogenase family)